MEKLTTIIEKNNKTCFECGRKEGEVYFNENRNRCNSCRNKANKLHPKFIGDKCKLCNSDITYWNKTGLCRRHTKLVINKQKRICKNCGNEYIVSGSLQKFCKDCFNDTTFYYRFRKFGVSRKIWNEMLEKQNNKCGICEENEPTVVDHDHLTNKVRGLLCNACNIALGTAEKLNWMEKAKEYISFYQNLDK